jgi:hypothetical protein
MLQYNQSEFYSYDPKIDAGRKETLNASTALRRRYYMVQRAKDAQTVGLLAGTLGVADYLAVLVRQRLMLTSAIFARDMLGGACILLLQHACATNHNSRVGCHFHPDADIPLAHH